MGGSHWDCRWLERREASGKKKNRSLLWWLTLTRSCCAQRQSIRHPALLLMSTGNKSEEAGLYFAAWLTCRSRHRPMCPCIPPRLTSPRLSFTRWESLPLFSPLLSISSIHYADSLFPPPFFFASPSCLFDSLFIFLLFICLTSHCVYALDKSWNTEGINHCHLAAQHVAHAARARVPCTSAKPLLLSLTSMNFKVFQYINLWETESEKSWVDVGDEDKRLCAFAIWVKYMFTRLQMRNPEAQRQFSYSPTPMAACLELRPPLVADFWNSYLDEWLKLRHSQPESHHSYLKKNGIAVIFWCIARHPACKRDTLTPLVSSRLRCPSLLLRWVPKELPRVIDQVPWHHWRHVWSLPTQPARRKHSGMLIWCDQ